MTPPPTHLTFDHRPRAGLPMIVASSIAAVLFGSSLGRGLGRAADAKSTTDAPAATAEAVPTENPLRNADDATRQQARSEAWVTFQRSCRPCHGSLGGGDGPYAFAFPQRAADLRRPSRDIAPDPIRFKRIRDGAAARGERVWESNMPAFGDELDARQIWGLVLLLEDFGREESGIDPNDVGSDVYAKRCAACHGSTGLGDGPLASELLPQPRDLVHGPYRFRSSLSGQPPLDSDIIGVTAHGLNDTAMGSFLGLGNSRIEDVAIFVQSLAPDVFSKAPETLPPNPLPAIPVAQMVARGRPIYESAKCVDCHGVSGRGDGPAAATLKDDVGHVSIATNLTKRWTMKSGSSPGEISRTLASGIDGTPMKSYASLSLEDRWAVAHYVNYLGRLRPKFAPTVQAAVVDENLPLDPVDPFWKASLTTLVPMSPQVEVAPHWTQPSVDVVEVVAAVNADHLGVLVVWDDRSRDVRNDESRPSDVPAALARRGNWHLADAVALQFPAKPDPKGGLPPAYLGDASHPVRRWLWSAERQESPAVVEQIAGARATPVAGTETPPVQTAATYANGQWRVLFVAKRPAKSVASIPMAVQAWDGGAGEAGQWQSFSAWLDVKLR